jgi:hypothetical protein
MGATGVRTPGPPDPEVTTMTTTENPRPQTRQPNAYEQLMEWGRDRGYQLDWMALSEHFGWTLDADTDRGGLLLQDVDRGRAAEVPERSDNLTGRPRGSVPRPRTPRVGNYSIRTKSDIWLKNAAALYEEAVQRQWSSAVDIPWSSVEELPDDIERAQCQLTTFLTEVEFVAGDVPGKWISETTPDYYEPRMFLISQIMDEARHMDVFRKRTFANGGGLLLQTPRFGQGAEIDSARDFTEMSARLHISGEGLVLSIFRMGERMSYNEAEKAIYRLAASDESRHVAFGVMHLQYVAQTDPERKEEIHSYLDEIEVGLAAGVGVQNPAAPGMPASVALQILLGGGADERSMEEGSRIALAVRQRQVKEYMQRIRVAGFGERFENGRANKALDEYLRA